MEKYAIDGKEAIASSARDLPKTITNAYFWPAIDPQVFVDQYRIPQELPDDTIVNHLERSMNEANIALDEYKLEMILIGFEKLADVLADHINGSSVKVTAYTRAVYCFAKASLLEEMQTLDRRKDADNLAKTSVETEDKYRQFAQEAIRAVCGESPVKVSVC